jgi:hypothetical protein
MGLPAATTRTKTTGGGSTTERNLRDALRDTGYNLKSELDRILLATMTCNLPRW